MRRSKLDVIRRLARLDAERSLRGLGAAQASVQRVARSLDDVRERSAGSRRSRELAPGQRVDAAALATAHRHEHWLSRRATALDVELLGARNAHELAREAVARAKLRVRAIDNAMKRRAERARLEARRAEDRRTDELSRGASQRREDG